MTENTEKEQQIFLQNIGQRLDLVNETSPFSLRNGIAVTQIGDGRAVCELEIAPHHLNHYGYVHGGVLYTMADHVTGMAAASRGKSGVTLQGNISYFKSASRGRLTARAVEINRSRRTGLYEAEITDEQGNRIAKGAFSYYIPDRQWPLKEVREAEE
jgi:acyl-CoA thioesterase